MKTLIVTVGLLLATSMAYGAELTNNEVDRSRGWQDREYFGRAYTEYQLGGGDGAAAGDSGDAGSSAGAGDGDSGGEGCSR